MMAAPGDSLHQQRDPGRTRRDPSRLLVTSGFNRTRTPADALGISRVTLYKKMKKYGLFQGNRHGDVTVAWPEVGDVREA